MKYGQTMISRETRRLLVTIAVSIAALWVLARLRFQEHPASQTAVVPVLAQLRPAASFDDLARVIGDLRPVLMTAVVPAGGGSALRVSGDRAIALAPDPAAAVVAVDRVTGLAVIAVSRAESFGLMPWMPRVIDYPRFFLVAERTPDSVAFRPIFVGTLTPVHSPYWNVDVWQLPQGVDLPPGRFTFTTEGALAGLSITERGRTAIVPAGPLFDAWKRISESPQRPEGATGVEVRPLSPVLASAAGVQTGVMVAMVDSLGPAANLLAPTDVIEGFNGREIDTLDDWRANVLRLAADDVVSLRVVTAGERRDVKLIAAALEPEDVPPPSSLGLQLAAVPDRGSRVVLVRPGSHAAQVSLQPGDIITAVGRQIAPTPAQIARVFDSTPAGSTVLFAFTRGSAHDLVAILKPTPGTQ